MKYLTIAVLSLFINAAIIGQFTADQSVSNNCGLTIADVNIAATGTVLGTGDDDVFPFMLSAANFPAGFSLAGDAATNMFAASTNGTVGYVGIAGFNSFNSCPYPDGTTTITELGVFHDDLVTTNIFFQEFAAGEAGAPTHPDAGCAALGLGSAVVYWSGVSLFGGGAVGDFAVVFYSNGDYFLVYDAGMDTASASVALEDGTGGTTFEFVSCDTAGQLDGISSICVTSDCGDEPPAAIPTLGQWGIIILSLSLFAFGIGFVFGQRRKLAL